MNFLEDTEKAEILFKSISRYDFYINTTNTKASLVLAITGLLVGTTLIRIESLFRFISPTGYVHNIVILLFAAFGLLTILSLYFTIKTIVPYFSSGQVSYPSVLFFRSVASLTLSEFSQRIRNLEKKECLDDLINQAHELATGLDIKMKNLNWAIYTTFFNFLIVVILIIVKEYSSYGIPA